MRLGNFWAGISHPILSAHVSHVSRSIIYVVEEENLVIREEVSEAPNPEMLIEFSGGRSVLLCVPSPVAWS